MLRITTYHSKLAGSHYAWVMLNGKSIGYGVSHRLDYAIVNAVQESRFTRKHDLWSRSEPGRWTRSVEVAS
jgi:hypothetical protein